ncbi:MAG TPA: HAMP domain-containing sensor histidine kinase [Candidatus Omnitrophota bacterium]|nr:HAMP domain-containing sensor histidine kinase [Candidatus Omnitrophota bacterium]
MKSTPKDDVIEKKLADQVSWLISLRWIAVLGVTGTVFTVTQFFNIPVEVWPLYGVTAFLAIYNGLFAWVMPFLRNRQLHSAIRVLANLQIFLDLTCLAFLIHFSGGVENPFYFYFIFHIIIAGILLSRRETFVLATYAVMIFLLIVLGEQYGLLPHHRLPGVFAVSLHENFTYVVGVSFVFVSALYIAAYLTTSISDRLHERERSLTRANELLGEKDKIKSEYVLRVTHDLKEDLAAIHTCIEPVQKGLAGRLNEEQTNLLSRAKERSKQLIVYVNALLEITRLKLTKKAEMNSFSVMELIQEISDSIGPMARHEHKLFEVQVDPKVSLMKGVRVYVQEALLNILKNSLKYTPEKGTITLRVQMEWPWLRMKIIDTGIGIPADELPKIATEFYRATNAKALYKKGTGLGLSIAKKIVEMHRGTIDIESKVGAGTCITLAIPLTL